MKKIIWCLFLCGCLVCFIGFVSTASAQYNQYSPLVKNGVYVGAMFVNNSTSGDFDDSIYYTTDEMLYNVPGMDDGKGFDIVLGTRMNRFSFEVGYQKTNHDVKSVLNDVLYEAYGVNILGDKATYNAVDFDFKFDLIANSQLRPYALMGFGLTWITVEDNALNLYDEQEDETFRGYCWNLGAGVAYYLQPQIAVTIGLKYRWNIYGRVESDDLDENLKENILSTSIGMAVTF